MAATSTVGTRGNCATRLLTRTTRIGTWIAAAVLVVKDVAVLGLSKAHGMSTLLERERNTERPVPLPCRPIPLASMPSADFQSRMIQLKRRLKRHRSPDLARNACDEQKELQLALTRSPRLKVELEGVAAKPTASFQSSWLPVMPGYPNLREVATGLAIVFPGMPSVESEFPILKLDKPRKGPGWRTSPWKDSFMPGSGLNWSAWKSCASLSKPTPTSSTYPLAN
jgi:hypothetical protein